MQKLIIFLLVVVILIGCQPKTEQEIIVDEPTNGVFVNLSDGSRMFITDEENIKLMQLSDMLYDYSIYLNNNVANLTAQLALLKNKSIDRITDPLLQKQVDDLIIFLAENLTASQVYKFQLDEILMELYTLEELFNPKNVTIISILSSSS